MSKVKTDLSVVCPKCGATFKNAAGLSGHMRLMHSEQKLIIHQDEVAKRLRILEKQSITKEDLQTVLIGCFKAYGEEVVQPITEIQKRIVMILEKVTIKEQEHIKGSESAVHRISESGQHKIPDEEEEPGHKIPDEEEEPGHKIPDEECIKQPGSEQKKISLVDQIKLLEDLLKQQLDRRDLLLRYDESGKPIIEKKPRPRGMF